MDAYDDGAVCSVTLSLLQSVSAAVTWSQDAVLSLGLDTPWLWSEPLGEESLTTYRYSHTYAGDLASALEVLPDLQLARQVALATGTDGKQDGAIHLSPSLSPKGELRGSLAESGGLTLRMQQVQDCW